MYIFLKYDKIRIMSAEIRTSHNFTMSQFPFQSMKTRRTASRPSTRTSTARTTWLSRRPPTTDRSSWRRSWTTWPSPTRSSTTPAPSRSMRGPCRPCRRLLRITVPGGWVGSHASSLVYLLDEWQDRRLPSQPDSQLSRWCRQLTTPGLIFLQRSTWGREGRTTTTTTRA